MDIHNNCEGGQPYSTIVWHYMQRKRTLFFETIIQKESFPDHKMHKQNIKGTLNCRKNDKPKVQMQWCSRCTEHKYEWYGQEN